MEEFKPFRWSSLNRPGSVAETSLVWFVRMHLSVAIKAAPDGVRALNLNTITLNLF